MSGCVFFEKHDCISRQLGGLLAQLTALSVFFAKDYGRYPWVQNVFLNLPNMTILHQFNGFFSVRGIALRPNLINVILNHNFSNITVDHFLF